MIIRKSLVSTGILFASISFVPIEGRAEDVGTAPAPTVAATGNQSTGFAAELGQRGHWYLMAPVLGSSNYRYDMSTGVTAQTMHNLYAQLALGRFVRDRFSLGVDVGMSYGWSSVLVTLPDQTEDLSGWGASAHLVLGWQRPLGAWFSFWPRVSLGGAYSRAEDLMYDVDGNAAKQTRHGRSIDGSVALPLVVHVSRHLFVEVAWLARFTSQNNGVGIHGLEIGSGTSIGLGGWI